MHRAADHHDASGRRESAEQARHEQEVPQVVGEELKLVAVSELEPRQRHDAGVANDSAELQALALHALDARTHAARVAELTGHRKGLADEGGASGPSLLDGAGRSDHTRSAQR